MIRIIVGPNAIKKEGLDRVTKSVTREIYKLSDETHCEILFLKGITNDDISYLLRNIIKLLDMELTIMTRVDTNDFESSIDQHGNELKVTIKVT